MNQKIKTMIRNLFIDYGYTIELESLITEETEIFHTFKIYLDSGNGLGRFKIPVCNNCIEDVDFVLYFQEQIQEKYPELFK